MIRVLAVLLIGLLVSMSGQFVPPNPAQPQPVVVAPVKPGPSPVEALKKFAACIAPNPELNITLPAARAVLAQLAADGFDVSRGLWCNETRSGATITYSVSEADLVGAGWPEIVPLNLTVLGTKNSHGVAALKKQIEYGWGYWWFARRWIAWWW